MMFIVVGSIFSCFIIAGAIEGHIGLYKWRNWVEPNSSNVVDAFIPNLSKRLKRYKVKLSFTYEYAGKTYSYDHEFKDSFLRSNKTRYISGKPLRSLRINPDNPSDFFIYSKRYGSMKKNIVWVIIPLLGMLIPSLAYFNTHKSANSNKD